MMVGEPVTTGVHTRLGPALITAIQTGTITIKRCHHSCCLPERAPSAARFASILADRRWAKPMPIWTFVVQLPDLLVVIDAGATPDYNDDRSWSTDPASRRLLHGFLRIDVDTSSTLPAQLRQMSIDPVAVDAVVLTHQHIDHTASVPAFTEAVVWTTMAEDRAAQNIGACSWRWRTKETRVRHVDVEGHPGGLGSTVDLSGDAVLEAIHTPGHTPGSVSIRMRPGRRLVHRRYVIHRRRDESHRPDSRNPHRHGRRTEASPATAERTAHLSLS